MVQSCSQVIVCRGCPVSSCFLITCHNLPVSVNESVCVNGVLAPYPGYSRLISRIPRIYLPFSLQIDAALTKLFNLVKLISNCSECPHASYLISTAFLLCGYEVQENLGALPLGTSRVLNQLVPKLRQTGHHDVSQEYQRKRERERLWLSESWLIVHPTIPREQRHVVWDVTQWAETQITETKEGLSSHYRGDHLHLKSAICSPYRPDDLPNC